MDDLTGKQQFTRNMVISWSMHLLVIVAGFILPRQISDHLGQAQLGIWDLGWSAVQYLTLANLGVGAALNRYVGLYRSRQDHQALSRATSVVVIWQVAIALLVLACCALFAWLVVAWVALPPTQVADTRLMLMLLGGSLAVKMLTSPAGAIITGCHRWDIQHSLNAMTDFLLALALVGIIALGGDLVALATVVLISDLLAAVIRVRLARRLCPTIRVSMTLWDRRVAWQMLSFGAKSTLGSAPQILIFQTVAITLAAQAGPAALAVFNRAMALVRISQQLTRKIAIQFTPMTSSLVGLGRDAEAKALLLNAGGYALAAALPMGLGLICYGDLLLELWMGKGYANGPMLILLVVGTLLPIAQAGTLSVLAGFNAHGRIALSQLKVTIISLLALLPLASLAGWNATVAATVAGASWTLSWLAVVPWHLRREFDIPVTRYLCRTLWQPLLYNLPLALLLYSGRLAILEGQWLVMLACWLVGALCTALAYWRWLLPASVRQKLDRRWQTIRQQLARRAEKPQTSS